MNTVSCFKPTKNCKTHGEYQIFNSLQKCPWCLREGVYRKPKCQPLKAPKPIRQKSITNYAKAKQRAWQAFSAYIRLRDCKKTTGTLYEGICFTCKKKYAYKSLQAGHFIPGRHNANLFEERGVHCQCYHCNVGLKGNPRLYDYFMREEYGQGVIDELDAQDKTTKDFSIADLEELRKTYQNKIINLIGSKQLPF
jgi:hypothetical protein